MYINQGEKFVDEAEARGVLDPGNGMGVSSATTTTMAFSTYTRRT